MAKNYQFLDQERIERSTLFFAKKSGIVLVEMADRAGSGSSEFHIEL